MKKSFIVVRTEIEGFHQYINAPEEVAFLKNLHRHLFKIKVKIQVFHNDREIEFFILKRKINKILPEIFSTSKSCEGYALQLLEYLIELYGNEREYEITVSEDSENDGVIIYE